MAVDYEAVKEIVEQYVSEVKTVFPVDKVYLYGSYANNKAQWDSDVDLCFFSESFTKQNIMKIIGRLYELKRRYNKYVLDYSGKITYIGIHIILWRNYYEENINPVFGHSWINRAAFGLPFCRRQTRDGGAAWCGQRGKNRPYY
jgi:predicted nucleotidyltransferase